MCYPTIDKKQLHIELLKLYNVRQEEYKMLFDNERNTPWLLDFKANHQNSDWKLWNRYITYLQNSKNFFVSFASPKTMILCLIYRK